jgi:hypothetical protein
MLDGVVLMMHMRAVNKVCNANSEKKSLTFHISHPNQIGQQ